MNTDKGIKVLVSDYLSECDIVEVSAQTYSRTLNVFINWMVTGSPDIRNPTKADIINFKKHLEKSGKTALTIDNYMKVLGLFFKWLASKGYHSDISKGTHHRKNYKGHRKGYLTIDQVVNLLKSLSTESLTKKRNTAIIQLMIRTGLRCIEVSRLSVSDIVSNDAGYSLRIQRKGHKEKDQVIGISPKVYDPIENYLIERKHFKESDPLFINHHTTNPDAVSLSSVAISRIVMNILSNQGLSSKTITTHSLRHTCAVNAYKETLDIYAVQKMLGHTNIQTTQIYISSLEAETLRINPACIALDKVY